jgi:DNA-binding NarL/FixJ family response regulator
MSAAMPEPEAEPIRVLIAEGRALTRAAMQVAIESEAWVEVIACVRDAASLEDALEHDTPGVAVIDASLPGGSIQACESIKERDLPIRVLIVTDSLDPAELLAAVEAGADGYFSRESSLEELIGAIKQICEGEAWIPPGMLSVLLRDMIRRRREELDIVERFSRMSGREREVLALLVEGLDQDAMAERLFLSPHTVRTHIQRALERLGVHSRLEAMSLVREYDLLARIGVAEGDDADGGGTNAGR